MKAIILAGGEATRLRPLSYRIPKILFPLRDKPLCLYQIEWLKKYNIRELIFALGYLPDKVKEALGDGKRFGIKIKYVTEAKPLDTAGAIRNAIDSIKEENSFLVFNGDILTNINISQILDFHKQKKSLLTICLVEVKEELRSFGLVICDRQGKIKQFLEKPGLGDINKQNKRRLINAGIYVFEPELVKEIPRHTRYSFEKNLLPALLKKKMKVYGFLACGYWQDIGTNSRYSQAQKDIRFFRC
ncbi:MAG: nucleotidyltransferase family protein [Candidatus Omnitrophota bacterium]|nr:nucleotidyltransferase family protein [Candidatus Omnitrophota bacterium]